MIIWILRCIVVLTALCTPRVVETYFMGTIVGTMTTNKTSGGSARQSVDVHNSRGENPTPPAKEMIPGKGLLVHCGGIASHAKQNMVKTEERINIRVVNLGSLMRSTKYPHYVISFSRIPKLLLSDSRQDTRSCCQQEDMMLAYWRSLRLDHIVSQTHY